MSSRQGFTDGVAEEIVVGRRRTRFHLDVFRISRKAAHFRANRCRTSARGIEGDSASLGYLQIHRVRAKRDFSRGQWVQVSRAAQSGVGTSRPACTLQDGQGCMSLQCDPNSIWASQFVAGDRTNRSGQLAINEFVVFRVVDMLV